MSQIPVSSQVKAVKEYYRRLDAGEFPAELFAKDFQFCFPKYGVGRGAAAFSELAGGMTRAVKRVAHHLDTMIFIEQGNCVAAEGTTEGTDADGVEWHGGRTRGGRFCSVFLFGQSGLIERLHIYMDPDCTGRHKEGFLWPNRSADSW
jgi:SnoaL-like domain